MGMVGVGLLATTVVSATAVSTVFVGVKIGESLDHYRQNPAAARKTRAGRAWHYAHQVTNRLPRGRRLFRRMA